VPSHSFPAGLQIYGAAIQFIVDGGFGESSLRASQFLAEEGVGKLDDAGMIRIDKTTWYPAGGLLRAFRRIEIKLGDIVLFRAGLSIPSHAIFPAGIRTPEGALRSLNLAYYLNHGLNGEPILDPVKGTFRHDIGEYRARRDGEQRVAVECECPYPCDLDRGIVEGLARRFEPRATVAHAASAPCRKRGAKLCTYSVAW
jgi:hypothetical protein